MQITLTIHENMLSHFEPGRLITVNIGPWRGTARVAAIDRKTLDVTCMGDQFHKYQMSPYATIRLVLEEAGPHMINEVQTRMDEFVRKPTE